MSTTKPTKAEVRRRRAEWNARLATGRVVENIVGGHRTLIGFPTVEGAQTYVDANSPFEGCASVCRIYTACMPRHE